MISKTTVREIVDTFIGDNGLLEYKYKSGPDLVEFINKFFQANDIYGNPFPSRWLYLFDYLKDLEQEEFEEFFQYILDEKYLVRYESVKKSDYFEFRSTSLEQFNLFLEKDNLKLMTIRGKIKIINFDEDLEEIGSGGFAIVYKSISSGRAVKKLREDFTYDKSLIHRFRREYELTKSLQGVEGIITVYDYDENQHQYDMMLCEQTLESMLQTRLLNTNQEEYLIDFILNVMSEVHNRNILHRDLSCTNILFVNRHFYISDFGIGKSLDIEHSHQTMNTLGVGQRQYVAPEQLYSLADSSKKSDVYSLGRIINRILTGSPDKDNHRYEGICKKATIRDPKFRYKDASEMLNGLEKYRKIKKTYIDSAKMDELISKGIYTDELADLISTLTGKEITQKLVDFSLFGSILVEYFSNNKALILDILNKIDNNKDEVCTAFSDADSIGNIGYLILIDDMSQFDYEVKILASNLLSWSAWDVNRFNMQRQIEILIKKGLEPTIEEILSREV